MAGISTTLALLPMVAINVRAPVLPHRVKLEILKALRTSPVSVTACLLNGLILTAFTTVGPLFSARIGFDQRHIVLLMACVSLGGLFLQWPIGYFSDKVDRLHALIGLGLGILAVAAALVWAEHRMPFALLALLVRYFRRPCGESVCGGRRSCQRPRRRHRLCGAVLDPAVRLGFGLDHRPHGRHLRHPTHHTERVLRLCHGADRRFHHVRRLAAVAAQGRPHRRDRTRTFWPIHRPRRKFTPGCRITARPRRTHASKPAGTAPAEESS